MTNYRENEEKLLHLKNRITTLLLSIDNLQQQQPQEQALDLISQPQMSKILEILDKKPLYESKTEILSTILAFLSRIKNSLKEFRNEILEIIQDIYSI